MSYYPFGMSMPGRERDYVANDYRFGYNGMEKDNAVKGNGNSYTTEFRQYDPRLGRWLSLYPLKGKYPWMSPYVAFDNNPIFYIDPYGLAPANGEAPPPTNSKGSVIGTQNNPVEMEDGPVIQFDKTNSTVNTSKFDELVQTIIDLSNSIDLSEPYDRLLPAYKYVPPKPPVLSMPLGPGVLFDGVPIFPSTKETSNLHNVLNVLGMIPVIGEVFDAANALIYAAEGDFVNASVSASSYVSCFGSFGTGARQIKKAVSGVVAKGGSRV